MPLINQIVFFKTMGIFFWFIILLLENTILVLYDIIQFHHFEYIHSYKNAFYHSLS